MRHVEAVIKLFNPAYNVRRISARCRNKVNTWFKRGNDGPGRPGRAQSRHETAHG
jgi:hypothetical protein